ncbi:MAG: hypothetical protein Q8O16_04665 [Dehalococcoidia bacterium]|nr:hypothetical protein [Dehalococcoidia bacterium]
MKCATHPEVETSLTCGKCGKPICPGCIVQTPVGARCLECARLSKLPTYRVTRWYYARAIGIGLAAAIICGIIWGFVAKITFFYINLLLAPLAGYAISEAISISVNRKRGTGLAAVAGVEVLVSYLVSIYFLRSAVFQPLDALALALGIFVSVRSLR